jgi:hypothetical protein
MTTAQDDAIDTFAQMSAALTGFTLATIQPALDPVRLSASYYAFVNVRATESLALLLSAYRAIATQPAQTIANSLLETASGAPASALAQLAQSIVRMWYLGSWYAPGEGSSPVQVISAQAYVGGLVWKAAQTHPMGYSEFTFGYWAQTPPALADFGVDVPSAAKGDGA